MTLEYELKVDYSLNRNNAKMNYLVGALKAGADYFRDAVHAVFRLLNDGVDFGESGRLPDGRVFHGELQLLDVRRDLVDVIEQLFLQRPSRYLFVYK